MAVYARPGDLPPERHAGSGTFSSCNVVSGPFVKFSAPFEGDDVSDIIDKYRDELALQRSAPDLRPPEAHRPPPAADATDHAEAAARRTRSSCGGSPTV